jgi:nucleotide-binding universal stress UspA family protein
MNDSGHVNKFNILLAIDFSDGMDRLLEEAERYGRALDATVYIIHVADPDPFVGYIKASDPADQNLFAAQRQPRAKELRTEHQQTQAIGAALRAKGVRVDQALTVQGPVLATVMEQAGKLDIDLLIMGSHHYGALYRLWHGDVATGTPWSEWGSLSRLCEARPNCDFAPNQNSPCGCRRGSGRPRASYEIPFPTQIEGGLGFRHVPSFQ